MNSIVFESKQEIENFKQKLKKLESIINQNSSSNNQNNQILYRQLKNKVNGIESNISSKMESIYSNILNNDNKLQKLPDLKERKRAISTDVSNNTKNPLLDESSFIIKQQALYRKNPKVRYQILNEFQDELSNLKIDLTFERKKLPSESQFPKRKMVKQKTQLLLEQPQEPETRKKLLNFHSLNQFKFFIKDGLRVTSFELMNLRNANASEWLFINGIIKRLELLNKIYNCSFFFVDGKSILKLLQKPRVITLSDLYECIINKEDIMSHFIGKLYLDANGQDRAATKIQSAYRSFTLRKKYLQMRGFNDQARKIQSLYKAFRLKQNTKKKINTKNQEIYNQFKKSQQEYVNDWLPNQQTIEIHVNSLSYPEYTRLTMEKFLQRENGQISRIFRCKEQNISIIYITSFQMDFEVLKYYERIFELHNIKFNRVRFIVPENVDKFPVHFSLLQKLLYSPKCLKKIRQFVQNKEAIIIPGYPSNEYIKLSWELQVPLYSGLPQHHLLYSTKSGAQILFNKCQIPTSPGASEIFDETEMINSLTVLIVKNPVIRIWVFKIDQQFGGRGIATVNVETFSGLQALLKPQVELEEATIAVIKQLIRSQLPSRLKIAVRTLYQNYQEYMMAFLGHGGIIEAAPPVLKSEIKSLSISFQIFPNGVVDPYCSYDNHSFQNFVSCLHTYPSKTEIDTSSLMNVLSDFMKQKKMFGFFTINLIMYDKGFWATGFQCYLNQPTSAYCYLTLLNPHVDKVYTFIPFLYHPGLKKVLLKNFFQICRMEQTQFEIENQKGQSFLFTDMLQSCVVQLVSMGDNFNESIQLAEGLLKLFYRVAGNVNVSYGESIYESRNDGITILEVQGAIRLIRRDK